MDGGVGTVSENSPAQSEEERGFCNSNGKRCERAGGWKRRLASEGRAKKTIFCKDFPLSHLGY